MYELRQYFGLPIDELSALLSAHCSVSVCLSASLPPRPLKGELLLNGSVGKLGSNLILLNQPPTHLLLDQPINPTSNELNWNEFYRNENAMNHHQDLRHVAMITTHTQECGVCWLIWTPASCTLAICNPFLSSDSNLMKSKETKEPSRKRSPLVISKVNGISFIIPTSTFICPFYATGNGFTM